MDAIIQMHSIDPERLMQMLKTLLKEEFKQLIQNMKPSVSDEFLSRKEAAEFLKISETKLWDLDRKQVVPAKRLDGKVLYRKSDLLNFDKKSI